MTTETHIHAKPSTAVIIITPEMATRWLENNLNNRPVSRVTVERYKRDMLAGLWHFTNAGIAFDIDGTMIDGQHRLIAISELPQGHGIAMNVTRGLAPESRYYIDQGRKRTPGNQLAMAGFKNYNHTAAGARLHLIRESGLLFKDNKQRQMISSPQVQEWVSQNEDLVELANQSHRDIIKNDAQPSVARAAFFAMAGINADQAALFFSKLHLGAGLEEGSPILALRQRLETDRRTKRRRSDRDQLGLLFEAWNLWRTGKARKSLSYKAWSEGTFPEPK